ncbi:MAG: DUF4493 domain-containing protein, partial [Parabacteroides sp.]|nr:DUF4493 domain-containing protein [Parabacteroides sp.]
MKKTLLIGLAAVVLGSMTACSNILEEEGVISPSAKKGLLTIGLDTDNALNIITKATENVDFSGVNKNNFLVTVTPATGTTIPEETTLPTAPGTYKVPVGTYNLSATYGDATLNLAWDNPCFAGATTSGVVVAANGVAADGTISCDLTNSIIDIVDASFANLSSKGITVNYVSVVMSDNNNIDKDTDLSSLTHYYFYHQQNQTSLK